MRRPAFLIAAGVAAFLLFLVAFLPASLLLRYVPPNVALRGVSGTVWRGSAQQVAVQGKALGALRWTGRPWRLLMLQLDYALELEPPGGRLAMDVRLEEPATLRLSQLQGQMPLDPLDGVFAPPGWRGQVTLDVTDLVVQSGFPQTVSGSIIIRHLTAPGPGGLDIGDFELVLGEGAVGSNAISGRLRDLGGGPMTVRATLELQPDHSYLLSGEVSARPDASAIIQRDLAFLGPADSLGRRSFAIEGTL